MQGNLNSTGTPFCISANALDIKFKDLLALLERKHRESQGRLINE